MSTVETVGAATVPPGARGRFPLVLRLAIRELRAGLAGFYVFIACVALGVAVITAVSALSDALRAGFEAQGERLLGGDVTASRVHNRVSAAERAWLSGRGRLSETATMRTMARTLDAREQILVELKGVDRAYPLVGAVALADGRALDAGLHGPMGGTAVDPIVLERLGLKIGDRLNLGKTDVLITSVIEAEPDSITDRQTLGPRVMVSLDTLDRTGLVEPGTLIRWRYALKLPPAEQSADGLVAFRKTIAEVLPQGGFQLADRRDPSPQITRVLDRLSQFLTLIGLTALLIGGVGVSNAVATFIDKRRRSIAIMKSVGARGRTVFNVFLVQVLLIAMIGIVAGLVVGYSVPVVLDQLYGDQLPIRAELRITAWSVASAMLYGLLVALLFTLWPLGRAELVPAGVLFRDEVNETREWPRGSIIAATLLVGAVLVGVAVLGSDSRALALYFCLGLIVVFGVFLGLGQLVAIAARAVPRPRRPEVALAIGNIGGPGNLTRAVVLSLGVGLTLLVAVGLADASLQHELTARRPKESPNYFVLDLGKSEMADFERIVRQASPGALVGQAPMLRGRLVSLKGVPVEQIKAPPEASWVLNGDRGLSYAVDVPDGSRVVKGEWWPADYAGEPLVSFEQDLARNLKLDIGDTVTVNVLGRNVTARIASLREVKWESLAINFVLVFSPNTLRAAPHKILATVTLPKDAPLKLEADLARDIGRAIPTATAIRVKDAITAFNGVFNKVSAAVRAAGSVTLIAGALVLAGALATAQRRRIQQAVILKALGATRRRILTAHAVEYALLAVATAAVATALGALAAWIVVSKVMDIQLIVAPGAILQALGVALVLMIAFGGIGTWMVLRSPTVPYLRTE